MEPGQFWQIFGFIQIPRNGIGSMFHGVLQNVPHGSFDVRGTMRGTLTVEP
jgi:hypothetical protein